MEYLYNWSKADSIQGMLSLANEISGGFAMQVIVFIIFIVTFSYLLIVTNKGQALMFSSFITFTISAVMSALALVPLSLTLLFLLLTGVGVFIAKNEGVVY